jgi:hypothetical protein
MWNPYDESSSASVTGQARGIAPCILKEGQRVKSMIKRKKAKGKEKLVLPLGTPSPSSRSSHLYLTSGTDQS